LPDDHGEQGVIFLRCNYLKILLVVFLVLLWPEAVPAEESDDLLERADSAYKLRADPAQAKEAVRLYRRAVLAHPKTFEGAWKLCRAILWVVEHDRSINRLKWAEEAVNAAMRAVRLAPDHPAGHFYLGIAYGYLGDARGIIKALLLREPIRTEMETVIRLDPGFEHGGAYLILGRLMFFLPEALGGSTKKAIHYLEKALKYGPRQWINHLYLAEAYKREGRLEEARALARQVLAGPAQPGYEPEYAEWKGEAEHLLNKLKQ
jgi:tetratricopeptide (TPR) repeat protein